MPAASYAKINLSLEVLGKLPSGYHQVETVLVSIDLHDRVKYTLTKTPGVKLWSNLPEMATSDNLIYRVAESLRQEFHPKTGVEIELEKRIPLAAGLGGGSSNAAVTILALNRLWELKLSQEQMEEIAASFGSDINYFLHGGCCLGEDRGQRITELEDVVIDNILLVNPHLRISSAEAYGLVDLGCDLAPHAWRETLSKQKLYNRLEPGIRARYPLIDDIVRQMSKAGARSAIMSGSGSTCFGIYDDINALNACRDTFTALGYWTHTTRTISRIEYQKCIQSLN